MDLFTQVKMAVSVKEAAEYYGLEVKRGSMVCCPFHNEPYTQHEAERGLLLLLWLWGNW